MSDSLKIAPSPAMRAHDHGRCVARVLDEAQAATSASGARFTPVRRRVLEILLESHVALGAYDILKRDTLVITKAGVEALEARLK